MDLLRLATPDDIPAIGALIEASVRGLQANDYSFEQREGALGSVFGVDRLLIEDRTYFVVRGRSAFDHRLRRLEQTQYAIRQR